VGGHNTKSVAYTLKLGGFAWELDLWAPYDVHHVSLKCEEQYMQYSLGPMGEGLILPKVKCMGGLLYYFYMIIQVKCPSLSFTFEATLPWKYWGGYLRV
jgi:hypothetical protein